MKSSTKEIQSIIGTEMGGGFYAGRIVSEGKTYALIVAPKDGGEHAPVQLLNDSNNGQFALSYNDGLANTNELAKAGSKLAKWVRDLRIGDNDDWYLPAQDELEIIYRNLKPTTNKNYIFNRSGINLSAVEPTRPYTKDFPLKTTAELFQEGNSEAFNDVWYWTSTCVGDASAWVQFFHGGDQSDNFVSGNSRARAVRRLEI
jgi:hypothetical protein